MRLRLFDAVGLERSASPDHTPLVVLERGHPAEAVDDGLPLGPGAVADAAGGAHGPVAGEHDAARPEGGEDDAEPGGDGVEDVLRRPLAQGLGHLGEGAGELHVRAAALAEGEDGGAPGDEGRARLHVVDAEVRLAHVVYWGREGVLVSPGS